MKKLKLLLIASLISTCAFAEDYKALNSKTMIGMESGLANIQKGFLYNNLDLVKYGASQIVEENKIYHDRKVIKGMLPEGKKQMENIALITSNRIDSALAELNAYIDMKDMRKAHDAFTGVVQACTDCHTIVRGW